MVETNPDMPHALVAVIEKLTQLVRTRQGEFLCRFFGAENSRDRLPGVFQTQQAFMLWVNVKKQSIARL